jgi:hypothetical protein
MKQKSTPKNPTLRELLACQCEGLTWSGKSVTIQIPVHQSTDMTGALSVAKMCCPEVDEIRVFAGGVPNILYTKGDNDQWIATDLRSRRADR